MPGKYSHLKGQITKFSGEPEYQDRVNREKERIQQVLKDEGKSLTASNYGDVLVAARVEKDRLENLVKVQNLTLESMSQLLVELLEGQDYTSLKLTNGISLSIKDDVYCSVEDKERFYNWISETDNESLLTVNYQTMSSLTKQCLIDDQPIPAGIATYFKQSITVRGAKGYANTEE